MNLPRLPHEPGTLADFYEQALGALGALCERTWHDRLEVVAEGGAARLWNEAGALHETELLFPPAESTALRDAAREVFPGCPLTFRLAEALRHSPPQLDRFVLTGEGRAAPPDSAVAAKLWQAQFPETARWRLETPFLAAHHFSLAASVRCEVQAIDQHWSLHRLALSLPDGALDEGLAGALGTATAGAAAAIDWPAPAPARWHALLSAALESALAPELAPIRARQERHLGRDLARIEEYFAGYEAELSTRAGRSRAAEAQARLANRLAAARAEREHRRRDQLARHEIRVAVHLDALLLVAEPAWRATVSFTRHREARATPALFIPRARRWMLESHLEDVHLEAVADAV